MPSKQAIPYSVIHIGANKTGSTTLQRGLFAKTEDLVYLGEDCVGYENYRSILNSMVSDDDYHYLETQTTALFNRYKDLAINKTFLYSNEDIMTSRVPSQCAKRLQAFLPEAEIVVVIRNQLTAIPSIYANHGAFLKNVPRSYWRRYVAFEDWLEYCTTFINYSYLDSFFYFKILNLYAGLFGKHKIHILFFEDFISNKKQFMNDLCEILRIDVDKSLELVSNRHERKRYTQREFNYHRFRSWFLWGVPLNKYIPFGNMLNSWWQGFLEKSPPAGGFMSVEQKERIANLYREDNTRLAEAYELPLEKYGYPLA